MRTSKRDVRLVTFGQGGDCCYCTGGSTISGYGNPDRPHAGEGIDIPDGTPALDTRAATDTDAGYSWVFKGPMVDVELPDGGYEACPVPSPILAAGLAMQPDQQFASLLTLQRVSRAKQEPRGPLDYVSVSEYVAGWRERGARVGAYKGGRIVWEN